MITLTTKEFTILSQQSYDQIVNSYPLCNLVCTCGCSSCLVRHGSYKRTVKTPSGSLKLCICRVKCKACGRTHALLLSSIIPYSQIPLKAQTEIIQCYETKSGFHSFLDSNLSVDENNISAVLRNYRRHWKAKLASQILLLPYFEKLIEFCFSSFWMQFMQIRKTVNLLFPKST